MAGILADTQNTPEWGSEQWLIEHESRRVPVGDFNTIDRQIGGRFGRGNIDLNTRKVFTKDLSKGYSSLESISVNFGGHEVLIPTVDNDGKLMSEQEAIDRYKETGEHLGEFRTPEEASKYAVELERRQNAFYENTNEGKKLLKDSVRNQPQPTGILNQGVQP